MPEHNRVSSIAIVDCGGQYTKVIDRRLRELQVHTEIVPLDIPAGELERFDALVLSGGPGSVYAADALPYDPGLLTSGKPMLGICYGMQMLARHFGGTVSRGERAEYGVETITVDPDSELFFGLEPEQQVLMSHGDSVTSVPDGFAVTARSTHAVAAMEDAGRRIVGVQFHPEVDLSDNGLKMLLNFVERIAGLSRNYLLEDRIEAAVSQIREQVGSRPVFALVSGGVDSAVTAALLLRALPPEQVHALHVDTGFMRLDESEAVVGELRALGLENLRHVNVADRFFDEPLRTPDGRLLGPLTSLHDPEEKRELVGNMFMEVLRSELEGMELDFSEAIFAQGTLRPDLIESGNPDISSAASSIKTHHNDVPAVRSAREQGRVVETNADWHKDEVRQVARELGLSEAIAGRQPFPGPGLVLRLITWDGVDGVPAGLDQQIRAELDGLEFSALRTFPFRTVGVQGDRRSYRYLTVIESADLSQPQLNRVGQEIASGFEEVNRVALLLAGRVRLAELEPWESLITREQVSLLQHIDAEARSELADMPSSQLFALLLPLGTRPGRYTAALRSIITNDYMTGRHTGLEVDYPAARLHSWAVSVLERHPLVDAVIYDVTGKPPGTVEWQ